MLAHEERKPFVPLLVGISHAEFQMRQPQWRIALGDATSIVVPSDDPAPIIRRIVRGLNARLTEHEGVEPSQPAPQPVYQKKVSSRRWRSRSLYVAAILGVFAIALIMPLVFTKAKPRTRSINEGLNVDLWVQTESKSIEDSFLPENAWAIQFEPLEQDGVLFIEPRGKYPASLSKNGPLVTARTLAPYFDLHFPILDFALSNTSGQTVFVSRVKLKILSEHPDLSPAPLPVLSPKLFAFRLQNEGWGPIECTRFRFSLFTLNERERLQQAFPIASEFENETEPFRLESFVDLDMTSYIKQLGIDTETLEKAAADLRTRALNSEEWDKVRRALGTYADSVVPASLDDLSQRPVGRRLTLAGVLDIGAGEQKRIIQILGEIPISPAMGNMQPGGHNSKYDVIIQPGIQPLEVSRYLKNGETDRFSVTVSAPKSMTCDFVAQLELNDGVILESRPIRMHLIVPRGNGEALVSKKGIELP